MLVDKRINELLVPGIRFVELGCGSGAIINAIEHQYTESIGIDFTDEQLSCLDENRKWEFIKADLNDVFPLENDWADCIVANQVIEHIYNPYEFARESCRILRPGGRLIVTTPNIRYIKNLWWILASGYGPRTAGGNTLDGEWDDGHIHYFTHTDMRDIFREAGFRNVFTRALVDLSKPSVTRYLIDKLSNLRFVQEFLAGNILLVADK